ncbi:hypothetical protein RintRC_2710 [Richelia intracellularis]|nr:hypothetical protein RintRC_2710 [Richelia intracellularis]
MGRAKLVDLEFMLSWASSMTWKGLYPILSLSKTVYQKGISLTKKAMKQVESRLQRNPLLPKWDITGARWTMRGGKAVLPLGSLYITGHWDEYWQFHLQQEHKPNHLALYSSGIPLMKQVLKPRCSTTPPPLPIPV